MTTTPGRTCRHYTTGVGHCGAEGVRFFLPGWRCPRHTPAAIAGEPEVSGQYCAPARCYCGRPECPAYPTYGRPDPYAGELDAWAVIDARAIASGRRRSNPADYAAARATITAQRERDARLRRSNPS
ncbi:hypothetical protein [Thermomonospora cellulosilytica]|uniref:Uncharacterized protein n=1 Tax=Thermomonospora cellulosilytica TaxID=1411118 RepID=A0A7W3MXL5_9ACTN|nr:hypothetical protein [Thermomonospora cellulosilytica]MBA9003760.1 hypothetical protein [Thermomonospora cellulosilytica]